MTTGGFGLDGLACPGALKDRHVTGVGPSVCLEIPDDPTCAEYLRYEKYYNCPPLSETCWLKDGQPYEPTQEEIDAMSSKSTRRISDTSAFFCKGYDIDEVAVLDGAGSFTGQDLWDAVVAANPAQEFIVHEDLAPVTLADAIANGWLTVDEGAVEAKQCGELMTDGATEVAIDTFTYGTNGTQTGVLEDDNGFSMTRPYELAELSCVLLKDFCVKLTLTKEDYTTLAAGK